MSNTNIFGMGMLSCLMEWDEETEMHLAHCLNFDLMECGKTADEAWGNLKLAVKQFIEYCYSNYPEGLAEGASREEWQRFAESLKHNERPTRVETIQLELGVPCFDENNNPVWMQGVRTDGSSNTQIQ
jgi:hypothetical protein